MRLLFPISLLFAIIAATEVDINGRGGIVVQADVEHDSRGEAIGLSAASATTSSPPAAKHDSPAGCTSLNKTLVFSQEDALASNNLLLKAATDLVNRHLDGILNVDLGLRGDTLQGRRVGAFEITARIRRLTASGAEKEECYKIPYEIRDIDECHVPTGHPLHHACHATAACFNTEGAYECICPDGGWGVRGSGGTASQPKFGFGGESVPGACGGKRSTAECCGPRGPGCDDPVTCLNNCKASFRCTRDPCAGVTCGKHARCEPGRGYEDHTCVCDTGFQMVDGKCEPEPSKVTDPCVDHTCPSNCRCEPARPVGSGAGGVADDKSLSSSAASSSRYTCAAKPGYTAYADPSAPPPPDAFPNGRRVDAVTACLSGRAPLVAVVGPSPLRLRQGDAYEELGVNVVDENEEDNERTVKITYSDPFGSYFVKTGEYSVVYSIETPWLPVKSVHKTRRIVVSDVDECTYDGPHARFHHQCVAIADCVNTDGSYACKCPDGYAGDGMQGGSGCADVRKPRIECQGRGCEPARFKACNCVGIVSADGSQSFLHDRGGEAFAESELQRLGAAVHCEALEGGNAGTSGDGSSGSGACFMAWDDTFEGAMNLTSRIVRGPLEKVPGKSGTWRFPYDVKDAAGNRADRAYYYIVVEAVDVLGELNAVSVPEKLFNAGMVSLALAAALLAWWLAWRVLAGVRTALRALQYVLSPYSLVRSKREFDAAYDFVLRVQSLGMLSEKERQRKTAAKWLEMLDAADGEGGDSVGGDGVGGDGNR